ncbi:MAG: SDR family NAD(P)-dependent oxidoreductase [Azospirillaceae bacterium]|nr:SDR family NAD(P)-dependent oxidoreductase [Azospirillaceae bacterium]
MSADLERSFRLEGRVAVITGAASGIGLEAAAVLGGAGARLMLADVNAAALEAAVGDLRAAGIAVEGRPLDVSDRAAVERVADAAIDRFGQIDVWANVAGIGRLCAVVDMDEATLDQHLSINLKGSYWGAAAAARRMIPRRSGSIINISSTAGEAPPFKLSAYAISKAGVNMLTRSLAIELGPHGIRANAVAPGFIATPLTLSAVPEEGRADFLAARARQNPLGIVGEPRDAALAMLYLASDASRYVTGQILRPNGGHLMR